MHQRGHEGGPILESPSSSHVVRESSVAVCRVNSTVQCMSWGQFAVNFCIYSALPWSADGDEVSTEYVKRLVIVSTVPCIRNLGYEIQVR